MVIRTSIFGPEVKNFYMLFCWFLRQKKVLGFTNFFFNGITTLELAMIIEKIINRKLFKQGKE